jgi:hypothetical protein
LYGGAEPSADGGEDEFNLAYKCLVFNLRKSAKSADEFFIRRLRRFTQMKKSGCEVFFPA